MWPQVGAEWGEAGALPSDLPVAGDQKQPEVWEPSAMGSFLQAAPVITLFPL